MVARLRCGTGICCPRPHPVTCHPSPSAPVQYPTCNWCQVDISKESIWCACPECGAVLHRNCVRPHWEAEHEEYTIPPLFNPIRAAHLPDRREKKDETTSAHNNKQTQLRGTGTATAGAGRFGHGVAGRTTFGVALECGLVGVAPTQQRLAIP